MSIKLCRGDCMNVLPELEANSVHAIITDLPYGTSVCAWDEIIPFEFMWKQVKRLLKPKGVFVTTAQQPFTSKLVMSNLPWFKYSWVWNKNNSAGFAVVKFRPFLVTEDICVFADGSNTYNPQMVVRGGNQHREARGGPPSELYHRVQPSIKKYDGAYQPKNILNFTKANNQGQVHPTQKPVLLYEYLIRTYTNEGETVLDFTMGSGTTGVACVQTKRDFIGIEIEEKYFKIAEDRINRMKESIWKSSK
jgi:DNA modification methylase